VGEGTAAVRVRRKKNKKEQGRRERGEKSKGTRAKGERLDCSTLFSFSEGSNPSLALLLCSKCLPVPRETFLTRCSRDHLGVGGKKGKSGA